MADLLSPGHKIPPEFKSAVIGKRSFDPLADQYFFF